MRGNFEVDLSRVTVAVSDRRWRGWWWPSLAVNTTAGCVHVHLLYVHVLRLGKKCE